MLLMLPLPAAAAQAPAKEKKLSSRPASAHTSRPLGRHSEGGAQRRSANSGHLLSARPPTDKALLGRPAASLNHTESSWLRCAGQGKRAWPARLFKSSTSAPPFEPIFVSITQELTSQLLRDHPQAPTLSSYQTLSIPHTHRIHSPSRRCGCPLQARLSDQSLLSP